MSGSVCLAWGKKAKLHYKPDNNFLSENTCSHKKINKSLIPTDHLFIKSKSLFGCVQFPREIHRNIDFTFHNMIKAQRGSKLWYQGQIGMKFT